MGNDFLMAAILKAASFVKSGTENLRGLGEVRWPENSKSNGKKKKKKKNLMAREL